MGHSSGGATRRELFRSIVQPGFQDPQKQDPKSKPSLLDRVKGVLNHRGESPEPQGPGPVDRLKRRWAQDFKDLVKEGVKEGISETVEKYLGLNPDQKTIRNMVSDLRRYEQLKGTDGVISWPVAIGGVIIGIPVAMVFTGPPPGDLPLPRDKDGNVTRGGFIGVMVAFAAAVGGLAWGLRSKSAAEHQKKIEKSARKLRTNNPADALKKLRHEFDNNREFFDRLAVAEVAYAQSRPGFFRRSSAAGSPRDELRQGISRCYDALNTHVGIEGTPQGPTLEQAAASLDAPLNAFMQAYAGPDGGTFERK